MINNVFISFIAVQIYGLSYIHLQRITVLRKIRRSLPLDQRKLYHNAMIKQTMLHASTVWTSCSVENIQKVFRLPKRAARVMLGADTKANSVELFKQLGWVLFYHEVKINKSILASRRIIGECPSYLTQMLIRNTDVNGRTSRHGQLSLSASRGVLPDKLGGGVRPTSQNPYPIYVQNLRFSLPYLWPGQKFDTLFMIAGAVVLNLSYQWRAFVEVLIDNDENVASSKKHTQFKTRVLKPYPI